MFLSCIGLEVELVFSTEMEADGAYLLSPEFRLRLFQQDESALAIAGIQNPEGSGQKSENGWQTWPLE